MPRGDKNQNGKRKPVTHITGEKDRKLNKKKMKIDKLQNILGGTSEKEGLQNWNFAEILEQRKMALFHDK
jgi:hypothetical protein